jgi:hypothetical protein
LSDITDLIQEIGLFGKPKEKAGFDPREVIQMALDSNNSIIKGNRQRSSFSPTGSPSSIVGSSAPGAPVDGDSVQRLAQSMAAGQYGWGQDEWNALYELVRRESGWNPNAANPNSTARGLFQKMTSIHGPLEADPAGQIAWGLQYIAGRYGTPSAALDFHNRNNWY